MFIQKKIVTCGSVDDGKSSLIGRVLLETKNIFNDQLGKLQKISHRFGTRGKKIDLALLMDGLQDEREQGITIDVAHKFIDFKNQRLVFCDSPGHKQYTSNVLTAASNCQIGVVLVDVTKGVLDQTLNHLSILDFAGVKNIIFAINKIDLLKDKKKYFKIQNFLKKKILDLNFDKVKYIPTSATRGDNVVYKSAKVKWYKGNSVLEEISKMKINFNKNQLNFLPVQFVSRFNHTSRHYFGNLFNGNFQEKDRVIILPSKLEAKIKKIYLNNNKKQKIISMNSYCAIELDRQLDITRGDIICKNSKNLNTGNAFQAKIIVTSIDKIYSGSQYLMRIHNKEVNITITKIKKKLFSNNEILTDKTLNKDDIAIVEIVTNEIIAFSDNLKTQELSRFILVDLVSNNTVAAGRINFALNRSNSLHPVDEIIDSKLRSNLKNQKPICIWFTGLSGSGKTTLAKFLEKKLFSFGKHTFHIDGDNLRLGINKDLGFTRADRVENIRRAAEVAKLITDAGLISIVSLISPFERDRQFAKSLFKKDCFFEIFVNTPLSVCKKRDIKGLYKKIKKNNKINNIGLSENYEKPKSPFLEIDTSKSSISGCVELIFKRIFKNKN